MSCVLIVDDDKVTAELLSASLEKEGFQVESCNDGTIGMAQVRNRPPNLLILDLGLPGIPGLEILEAIRNSPQLNALPIIVVTVRDEEADAVIGLGLGADDYIVKPVRPRELVARVKRLLRRSQRPDREAKRIEIGDFIIDPGSFQAWRSGQPLVMSTLEFRLLFFLASHPGQVFSRTRLLDEDWGKDRFVTERSVDTYMWRLRNKIERDPNHPVYLTARRGAGYVFTPSPAAMSIGAAASS